MSLRRGLLAAGLCSLVVIAVLLAGAVWSRGPQRAAAPAPAPAVETAVSAPAVPPPEVGDVAPDFTLCDVDGAEVRLRDWRGRAPVFIEFGSISCPFVATHADELDRLAHKYGGQAQFWFIYADEAHPGNGEIRRMTYGTYQALPQVRDYGERCARAQRLQATVKGYRRMLVDNDGAASVAARYGIPGHGFVVVDVQGHISSYAVGTGQPPWREMLVQQFGPSLPMPTH